MAIKDMTVKEKVLRMVERLPDDVTYDRVLYHVEFMQEIEKRLEEAERGEGIPHEQVFAELLADDAKKKDRVARSGMRRPAGNQTVHRSERAADSGSIRSSSKKRGRKA
ncbi:MAG TPA: hypothetical protein VNK04_22985 [Gemmataceae bacterium]|nr:hypothetical protein [Gemmataceae bacterium]